MTTLDHRPDADVRPPDAEIEWAVRCDLAACFRAVALFGWEDLLSTHASARIPGSSDFLINPFGVTFDEMTASSLVRYRADGQLVEPVVAPASTEAVVIQKAVLDARPDVGCAIHLHTEDGIAVSTLEEGLLPAFQRSILLTWNLAYHEHEGTADQMASTGNLASDLGDCSLMILRNHGTLTVGADVGEAFVRMYHLERACAIQTKMLGMGRQLRLPSPEAVDRMRQQAGRNVLAGAGNDVAWAAMRRKVDRLSPGYDT